MNKQRLFKTTAQLIGFLLLILLIMNRVPAPFVHAAAPGWTPLTGGSGTGTSDVVNALGLDNSNNLYVGGDFVTAGGITVNDIAQWNGTDWSGFTGPSATGLASGGYVSALLIDNTGRLFITGDFATVGGLPVALRGSGAKWNGTAWEWLDPTPLHFVLSAAGLAMIQDNSNNIYFGGVFGQAGDAGITVLGITRYVDASITFFSLQDATTSIVGVNTPIDIRALALDGSNHLYAAGAFTIAGGEANTARIARWDGSNWFPLGAGIDNGRVNALAFDNLGNLYAGGTFTSVNGGTPAAGIAMWDGSTWTPLGSGVSGGSVNALAFTPDNVLYVGGSFTSAGGVAGTSRLARWSNGWRALPEGTPSGTVNALQYDAANNDLYVGGFFATAGTLSTVVNNVAIYHPTGLVVTTASDVIDANGGVCAGLPIVNLPGPDGFTSLREAICAANAAPGPDSISFAASLNGIPITLSIVGTGENQNVTGDLDILDDLTIVGNGPENTIVQAGTTNLNGIDRVFDIRSNDTVVMESLTVRFGRVNDNGAGIYNNSGNLTMTEDKINENSANFGGAFFNYQGTITIERSTVADNSAVNNSGGVDNTAFSGGATLNVYNSTFSGNSAGFAGGAILAYTGGGGAATVNLVNATIHDNLAAVGALTAWDNGNVAVINMENSLVADQTGITPDCVAITGGTFVSNNYNLDSDGTCNLVQANDIPDGTANLGPLQDNGGHTQTHALLTGSQAIDSGNNTTCAAAPINNVDQRGVARPQNTTCDIGAYELVTAVTPGAAGGLGPGGVGHTDGSTPLVLWLRADSGPFTDATCISGNETTTNGDLVQCWEDKSGFGADSTQITTGNRPNYQTSALNGLPVVRLDGTNDYFNIPLSVISGKTSFSFFTAGTLNAANGWQRFWDFGQNTTINAFITPNSDTGTPRFAITTTGAAGEERLTFASAIPLGSGQLTEVIWDGSGGTGNGLRNGNPEATGSSYTLTPNSLGTITQNYLGRSLYPDPYLSADIGDFIVFDTPLNATERILIENYLSAKYNIPLAANDVYDGDTGGNGNFDLDVAGIGRFGGNNHTQAHAAGMIVVNDNFLQDNGDWLLFGHRTLVNSNTTAELPTGGAWSGSNDVRWARHWYIDVTDAAGVNCATPGTCFVDIVFDFSEAGMNGGLPPGGPISNYRLLKRTLDTGSFSDIATATAIVGDQVLFQGIDVSLLGSNFTLGSLDGAQSPTAVTLQAANTNTPRQLILPLMILLLVGVTVSVWVVRYARIPSRF